MRKFIPPSRKAPSQGVLAKLIAVEIQEGMFPPAKASQSFNVCASANAFFCLLLFSRQAIYFSCVALKSASCYKKNRKTSCTFPTYKYFQRFVEKITMFLIFFSFQIDVVFHYIIRWSYWKHTTYCEMTFSVVFFLANIFNPHFVKHIVRMWDLRRKYWPLLPQTKIYLGISLKNKHVKSRYDET